MKEQLLGLDSITLNFGAAGMQIINYVLALIMFGVALGVRLDMFKKVFTNPNSVILGLCLQWFALPAVTFALVCIFKSVLTPMIALGMILVASCPGGNISNFMSSFAKGNIELSVSMTAISTAAAPFITPFNFWLWGNLCYKVFAKAGEVPSLVIPFKDMFFQVLILLGVPIVLGMLFTHFWPKAAAKIKKPFQYFSILVFIAMVSVSFANNWELFIKYIFYVVIIVFVHNACALGTGYLGATLFKCPNRDRRSLTIEVGIQNSGLGLLLLFNPKIFPPETWSGFYGGMLFVTAWWGIWHIISGLTVAGIFKASKAKIE